MMIGLARVHNPAEGGAADLKVPRAGFLSLCSAEPGTMIDEQSAWGSAAFHLVPGALNTIAYLLIAYGLRNTHVPAMVAMMVASLFVLLPLELFLVLRAPRTALYLKGLRATPDWRMYLATTVVFSLLLPGIVVPFEPTLKTSFFAWVPPWAQLYSLNGLRELNPSVRVLIAGLSMLVFGVAGPIVEEIYFRAFLLPRIARWGWKSATWSALLFSVYHFWQPWTSPAILFSFVVPCLVVWRSRNPAFSLVSHVLTNLIRLSIFFASASTMLHAGV